MPDISSAAYPEESIAWPSRSRLLNIAMLTMNLDLELDYELVCKIMDDLEKEGQMEAL